MSEINLIRKKSRQSDNLRAIKNTALAVLSLILLVSCAVSSSAQNESIRDISVDFINEIIDLNKFIQKNITIINMGFRAGNISFSTEGNISPLFEFSLNNSEMRPGAPRTFTATVFGNENALRFRNKSFFIYNGNIVISGVMNKKIPANIIVTDGRISLMQSVIVNVNVFRENLRKGGNLTFIVNIQNLMTGSDPNVSLAYTIVSEDNSTIEIGSSENIVSTSKTLIEDFMLPMNISEGNHILRTKVLYFDKGSEINTPFRVFTPFYLRRFFGIAVWQMLSFLIFAAFGAVGFYFYRKKVNAGKRYGISVDFKAFPEGGKRVKVGRFAEYNRDFFFDLDKLTTHCIVAGATGAGKSVAAQVLIEEALRAGVAVVVFDPTAQWSGFLRPCVDREMLRLYPLFGLRRSDARGFPGNVRQVLDAREVVDVKRFLRAGEIEILSLNTLRPEDIDVFVANTVRSVFAANLDECRELRLLLVYDEVHRLLPRFGGSGEGFIQIERACREFRKWGVGVVLISQVLSDFVGEIKANINTEIQMRTRDEGDLGRIKDKYGDAYLKGLVRASVGTGMLENPVYNGGRPFFVGFRPLLHSVFRLSDAELGEYNRFNGVLDDLDFEVLELERLGLDVFDLRLELKLAGDKLRAGGFGMVDVYLEGLVPRVRGEFERLGRVVPKRVVARVSVAELERQKKIAEKGRKDFQKADKKNEKQDIEEKKEAPVIVNPLTFDNGAMVSDAKELSEALDSMSVETLRRSISGENKISKWIKDELKDEALSKQISEAKTKKQMLEAIFSSRSKKEKEMKEAADKAKKEEKKPQ